MKIDDVLDSLSIDGLDIEIAVIETVYRGIRSLKLMMDKHVVLRDRAKQKAAEALDAKDEDSYQRWMQIYWKEYGNVNFINDSLQELNIITEGENKA